MNIKKTQYSKINSIKGNFEKKNAPHQYSYFNHGTENKELPPKRVFNCIFAAKQVYKEKKNKNFHSQMDVKNYIQSIVRKPFRCSNDFSKFISKEIGSLFALEKVELLNGTVDNILVSFTEIINKFDKLLLDGQAIGTALYGLKNRRESAAVTGLIKALTKKIDAITDFTGQTIGNALYGLQNLQDSDEIKELIKKLTDKIDGIKGFKGQEIGMALYGLQNLQDSDAVKGLLVELTKKIADIGDFTGQNIGMALYGLQNLQDSDAVKELLVELTKKIAAIGNFDGQAIGMALYGLQNLRESPELINLLVELTNKIAAIGDFTGQNIGMALYGLQNLRESPEVINLIVELTAKIAAIGDFTGQNIGNALYGLQNLQESPEVINLIVELTKKIAAITEFKGQEIGMALYGLQNLRDSDAVKELLVELTKKIAAIKDFTGQAIGMALYGLKNLRESPEVINLLVELTNKIAAIGDFTGQNIGNALYGLQNLQDSDAVKKLLVELTAKIAAITDFTGQTIGNALYGLQNLRDSDAVINLIVELTKKIAAIKDFTGQAIGNALYGLQNLRDSDAVINLIVELTAKIAAIGDFTGQNIGNALYGLQNLQESPEVINLIVELTKKIAAITEFKGQEIGMALYGLQNLRDSDAVINLLVELTKKIATITEFKGQEIGMALYGLQNLRDSDAVINLIVELTKKIAAITEFKGQEIGMALYGLQNMDDSQPVITNLKEQLFQKSQQYRGDENYRNQFDLTNILYKKDIVDADYIKLITLFDNSKKYDNRLEISELNKLLRLQLKHEDYDEAINLFEMINNNRSANISTLSIMLNVYARCGDYSNLEVIIKNSDNMSKDIYWYVTLAKIKCNFKYLNQLSYEDICTSMINKLDRVGAGPKYRKLRTVVLDRLHSIINNTKNNSKIQNLLNKLIEQMVRDLDTNSSYKLDITAFEANLLAIYSPKTNITPSYTQLTESKINLIFKGAYEHLQHRTQFNKKLRHPLHKITAQGALIEEFKLNESCFAEICNRTFKPYVIINFLKPIKVSKLPLFLNYAGNIYRTDIFGGSKLTLKMSENRFGSLIGIPIEATDFFHQWLNFNNSFWYGQRAFLPEEPDQITQGLKGWFKLAIIRDSDNFPIRDTFKVRDGFGYIKKSVFDNLAITKPADKLILSNSLLTYQALQHYNITDNATIIKEIFHNVKPDLDRLLNKQLWDKNDVEELYSKLSLGLDSKMGVAIPITGKDVMLPNSYNNYKPGDKFLIGRNPYVTHRPISIESVQISEALSEMESIQYSLIGYEKTQLMSDKIEGRFFKGMLGVIPDESWPKLYSDRDIIVSAKDTKLYTSWNSQEDKNRTQSETTRITLNGMFVVKNYFRPGRLVGIPDWLAEVSAGDYDGDEYNITPINNFPELHKLVSSLKDDKVHRSKIDKSFIKKDKVGNFEKIMQLRFPLLERWTAVCNVLYALSPEQLKGVAVQLTKLEDSSLFKPSDEKLDVVAEKFDTKRIVAEAVLGVKYGEDATKTEIPFDKIITRLEQFEFELRKIIPTLAVAYGKSLKRKLVQIASEADGKKQRQQLLILLKGRLKPKNFIKSKNIVGCSFSKIANYIIKELEYTSERHSQVSS